MKRRVSFLVHRVQYRPVLSDEEGDEGAVPVVGGHVEGGAVGVVLQLGGRGVLEEKLQGVVIS